MGATQCSEEGCDRPVHSRGLCQAHYRYEMRRAKDPGIGTRKPGPKPDPTKPYSKHRPAKERVLKPACKYGHPFDEENTYIDPAGSRQCRTCRADRSNKSRAESGVVKSPGVGYGGANRAKTHCPQGHPYEGDNLRLAKDGKRLCHTCSLANGRRQALKRRGLTPEEFQRMLDNQGNRCAICSKEFQGKRRPSIDHDHNCCPGDRSCSKCVRGLLCESCNQGLGFFNDDPALLEAAIVYLGLTTRGDQLTLVVSP